MKRDVGTPVAVSDPRVGARGCLAGADAVASAYSTCGIEAALLGIPVLEIGPPGERTLGLTGHGLATRCEATGDVAEALSGVRGGPTPIPRAALDEVCRWRGDSAARIARLITNRSTSGPRADDYTHHHPGAAASPQDEGASVR